MSLHKLAEVTITVYGLPEHCGTDEKLQELSEGAEALLDAFISFTTLYKLLHAQFPGLADKIDIIHTTGS